MTTVLKKKTELPNVIFVKLHKEDLWKKTELKMEGYISYLVKEPSKPPVSLETIVGDASTVIQEVDLMNFDDEIINNNNLPSNILIDAEPSPNIIDILLCDPTFGSNNSKNDLTRARNAHEHGKKALVEKPSEKEKVKQSTTIEIKSRVEQNNDNGVQIKTDYPRATTDTTTMKKDVRTEVFPMKSTKIINSTTKTNSDVKPRKRKVYTFMELILYKYSPLTKEIKCDFSLEATEYNLLLDKKHCAENDSIRVPGRRRNSDYNGRIYGESNLYVAPAIRKICEFPSDLSFINELLVAHNRWIALVLEKELRKAKCSHIMCTNIRSSHTQAKDANDENCVTPDVHYHETTRPRKAVRFLEINEDDG
ncbi:5514_t:CDS:2 [Scutellospora calospora]|uniref:5514_t:CDS:1 n=1 Tax=Scutellospora calospora TaxID=85575 RepID=A0ACA9L9Z6_9GLOM|nr:5514_t:CDS:2 [Scutellospora calospora]